MAQASIPLSCLPGARAACEKCVNEMPQRLSNGTKQGPTGDSQHSAPRFLNTSHPGTPIRRFLSNPTRRALAVMIPERSYHSALGKVVIQRLKRLQGNHAEPAHKRIRVFFFTGNQGEHVCTSCQEVAARPCTGFEPCQGDRRVLYRVFQGQRPSTGSVLHRVCAGPCSTLYRVKNPVQDQIDPVQGAEWPRVQGLIRVRMLVFTTTVDKSSTYK